MVRKGERTRRRILERTAGVFNTKGYFGSSMGDLVRASRMEKGGIYNHFGSKEELALEAFDYAASIMRGRFEDALRDREGALERLYGIVDVLGGIVNDPPVEGGCPVMNTAIEADDAHPALRERASAAMGEWLRLVGRTVKDGVASGELRPDADPREVASVVVATLEGAVMLSRLHDDPAHVRRAVAHLREYLAALAKEREREGEGA
jgi:TetR/AcrR family transcriptional regulator, transcriptional repressor for nem operon